MSFIPKRQRNLYALNQTLIKLLKHDTDIGLASGPGRSWKDGKIQSVSEEQQPFVFCNRSDMWSNKSTQGMRMDLRLTMYTSVRLNVLILICSQVGRIRMSESQRLRRLDGRHANLIPNEIPQMYQYLKGRRQGLSKTRKSEGHRYRPAEFGRSL